MATTSTVKGVIYSGLLLALGGAPAAAEAAAIAGNGAVLDLYGGADDENGLYGGAGTFALPLGETMGLQVDGIAGGAGDGEFYGGGAGQLFYRDPQRYLLGIAAGGYAIGSVSQYAVGGIAEFYLDTVTLEASAGYQGGDIKDGWFGRAGVSLYATPSLKLSAGVRYDEVNDLGGDVGVEALVGEESGIALFASGVFDREGALGLAGVRFYFGGDGGHSLMERQRNGARPNFLTGDLGLALRQIGQAAAFRDGGQAVGDLQPAAPTASLSVTATSAAPAGTGLTGAVGDLLGDATAGTALAPVTGLAQSLLAPAAGVLAPLTGPLEAATAIGSGPLAPVTQLVATLGDALAPALNTVLGTAGQGLDAATAGFVSAGGPLAGLPGVGDLLGAVVNNFAAGNAGPKTETTLSLVGGLLGGAVQNATGGGGILTDVPVLGDQFAALIGPDGQLADVPMIGGLLRGVLGGLVE